jgi:hypothetical protein
MPEKAEDRQTGASVEKRSEVARVWSRKRTGMNICGVGWANVCRVRRDGRARASPYPSHIRAGYEGCRSIRAFEGGLRRPAESVFCDRSLNGRQPERLKQV